MKLNSIILGISPVGDGFPVVTERLNGDTFDYLLDN